MKPFVADPTAHHYTNAHFPGLNSVVLRHDGPGRMTRMFIAPPGMLHQNLLTEYGAFLWHAHAYRFRETTIAGAVWNINLQDCEAFADNAWPFYVYRIDAGINSGRRPRLAFDGERWRTMRVTSRTRYDEGQSYELAPDIIHRVVFEPNPQTGWFACLVEELADAPAPDVVFSPHYLTDVPDADRLYVPISTDAAQYLLDGLRLSLLHS